MTPHFVRFIKKCFRALGILEPALAFKRRFLPAEVTFRPCTPHLQVAVARALFELKASALQGDYLEFGIFRGYTLWYAQQIAKVMGLDGMRYFGFDSFQGIPRLKAGEEVGGEFAEGQYEAPRKLVEQYLSAYGVDWSEMELVEGFFDKSLKPSLYAEKKLERCRLAVIDCDIYSGAKEALTFLAPLLQTGTIVLFDDWNSYGASDDMGERRAFKEFLAEHPRIKAHPFGAFGNHGMGFKMAVEGRA